MGTDAFDHTGTQIFFDAVQRGRRHDF
jgi:hypothetical protein